MRKTNYHANKEVLDFADQFSLSKRELEIFVLLINQISTSNDLATYLNLSANTVSNHLKNILTKSRCHSKTDLLAEFIVYQHNKLEAAKVYLHAPRVAIVSSETYFSQGFGEKLEPFGISWTAIPMEESKIDAHSTESTILLMDLGVEARVRAYIDDRIENIKNGRQSLIVLTPELGRYAHIRSPLFEAHEVSTTIEQLAVNMIENHIELPFIKSRFRRINTAIPATLNDTYNLSTENIGHGGAFIKAPIGESAENFPTFSAEDRVRVKLTLDSDKKPFEARAKVIWQRVKQEGMKPSGIGVQFIGVRKEQQDRLKAHVRQSKQIPSVAD